MSDTVLKNNLHEFRFVNGYGVKILEPMKRFHMTYADLARQNSVDLIFEATLPIVMFGDGKHFEQTMKVRGELVLRGKRYDVDCFTVRDRSSGKASPRGYNAAAAFFLADWNVHARVFVQLHDAGSEDR